MLAVNDKLLMLKCKALDISHGEFSSPGITIYNTKCAINTSMFSWTFLLFFFFQLHPIAIPPTTFFLLFSKNHFSPTLQFIFFSLGAASVMIARFHSIPFRPKKKNSGTSKIKIYRWKFSLFLRSPPRDKSKFNFMASPCFITRSCKKCYSLSLFLLALAVVAIKWIYSTSKIQL